MKNKYFLFLTLVIYITAGNLRAQKVQSVKRPNVIIVLTDDQGYGDFSCLGNPVLKTPYMDRFYQESIRFSNFHVAPLCTPTRGELMTGLDALHNKASTVLTGRGLMRRDVVTMPEVFRNNGYSTGIFGKWHLGDTYPDRPMDRGFEKNVWIKGWGLMSEMEFDNDYYRTRYMDGTDVKLSDQYCTDLWFEQAIKWMDELSGKQKPFFTYISLNAPHGPFYGPKKNTDEYRNKTADEPTANFFGMISNIDENMQRLDEWLIKKKLKDNTLVILMNDNGGTGGVKVFNAGMRGQKTSNYDGGHRAACFVRWPSGKLGNPRTVTYPSTIQDLLPSFIDLFEFTKKPKQSFDGVSLKKWLRNPEVAEQDRMLVVQYTGENENKGNVAPVKYDGCVVYNNWRLVGDSELYQIQQDPGQKINVVKANPDVYRKMHDFYESWWEKLSPGIDSLLPIYIGYSQENPVILNSNNWSGKGVNTQWGVAQGAGSSRGGNLYLYVNGTGKYRVELSRWPFHLNRSLLQKGPGKAVGGTIIREGKELPIAAGKISLNNAVPVKSNAMPGASNIVFEMNITSGENNLQAWFTDKDDKEICGAYYVRIQKL